MGLFGNSKSTGYGKADALLARNLRSARSQKEADQIARKDGHKDAKAATRWLKDRSR